jgi:hypothetical protein
MVIYAKDSLSVRDRIQAAEELASRGGV